MTTETTNEIHFCFPVQIKRLTTNSFLKGKCAASRAELLKPFGSEAYEKSQERIRDTSSDISEKLRKSEKLRIVRGDMSLESLSDSTMTFQRLDERARP